MEKGGLVRVYEPAGVVEIAQIRLVLEGAQIPYFLQNEHLLTAHGLPFSLGAIQVFVLVPTDRAQEATELLRDWFGRGSARTGGSGQADG